MKKIKEFLKNKWLRFGFAALVFLLMVIWIGSYWMLIGLAIVYDVYISKKVRWAFWKKWERDAKGRKRKSIEWLDAIIFAVVAATIIRTFFIEAYTIPTGSMEKELLVGDYLFVSKYHYGPRIPNTPLSLPFMHHTVPGLGTKAYSEAIQWDYKRLGGLQEVERGDIVVFNLPVGDTVIEEYQSTKTYYQELRAKGRAAVEKRDDIIVRPVDKRENYVKRCVALHGDTLQLIDGRVYINGKMNDPYPNRQKAYILQTDGSRLNERVLRKLDLSPVDYNDSRQIVAGDRYLFHMRDADANKAKAMNLFTSVDPFIEVAGQRNPEIFPHSADYPWNKDQFGPMVIPAAGMSVKIDMKNIALYERVIKNYEGNTLSKKDGKIFINGEEADEYTFQMDYFWMMGDNRDNSQDSRFWGFVPEDHVVGTPVVIWMSRDNGWGGIRWSRIFNIVN